MILKVATGDLGGWKFYDSVVEISHHLASLKKMKELDCDGRFFLKDSPRDLATICIFKQNGEEKTKMIVHTTSAYLLNDEGKTIERI